MRTLLILVTCATALASCNKGPQVNLRNASANQVSAAVRQSGLESSAAMVEPGLWQSKVTVQEMTIPGLPPQFAAKMKESMAEHQQQASKHCLTQKDARKPKEDFFAGQDKACTYQHFTMGAGRIDIQMVCKEPETVQSTSISGSYTPTSYSIDMASTGSGGAQQGMTMKMHVDAQRIGECTGSGD